MSLDKKQNGAEMSAIERRKVKNWWARITLSWAIVGTFLILIYLLFFTESILFTDNSFSFIPISPRA